MEFSNSDALEQDTQLNNYKGEHHFHASLFFPAFI